MSIALAGVVGMIVCLALLLGRVDARWAAAWGVAAGIFVGLFFGAVDERIRAFDARCENAAGRVRVVGLSTFDRICVGPDGTVIEVPRP